MGLDDSLPLPERQRLSAEHTHQQKRQKSQKSQSCIQAAVRYLLAAGEAITFSAIARHAGLVRQTVAKYRELIDSTVQSFRNKDSVTSELKPHSIGLAATWSQARKYGVNFGGDKITNRQVAVLSSSWKEKKSNRNGVVASSELQVCGLEAIKDPPDESIRQRVWFFTEAIRTGQGNCRAIGM
jgi:hypothetical protein